MEKDDFDIDDQFRTGENTLEAKQFFKSLEAIREFVENSKLREYDPPYVYLLTINVNKVKFNKTPHTDMPLDGYEAITIHEDNLPIFNNCVNFVNTEIL
ncbi:hypothetical protein [Mucilaginibacter phyllosphaerae]|uniref:Uncharacterized protein n=1 Tax=Mucilaginibacter phyllosphaerae TaxID=1812349 RepID=A0A4Y8ABA3_9SPHI|nr:hypothetical protein [Mucilaginibacter phyllosphaerae]MBB3969396.1 hypothetical protein [Mucilaginibacter phyllosphaerae]TEW65817.1 hypothetical protein E2R65_11805 [Mucilaginibacter phyllosphaerae]